MPSPSPIRLVCFDLGGVLIRICRSWGEGCAAAGLPVRGGATSHFWKSGSGHELVVLHQTGKMKAEEYAARLAAVMGNLYTPAEILRIHHAWMLGEYEGVDDIIDRIHAAGLTTACLSNTNHAHWVRMPEFSTVMKLHHRLASHEMGLHKPDPAIFREFQNCVGISGHEILFFDDLEENVLAARQAGWNAILIDHTARTDQQILKSLRDASVLD